MEIAWVKSHECLTYAFFLNGLVNFRPNPSDFPQPKQFLRQVSRIKMTVSSYSITSTGHLGSASTLPFCRQLPSLHPYSVPIIIKFAFVSGPPRYHLKTLLLINIGLSLDRESFFLQFLLQKHLHLWHHFYREFHLTFEVELILLVQYLYH